MFYGSDQRQKMCVRGRQWLVLDVRAAKKSPDLRVVLLGHRATPRGYFGDGHIAAWVDGVRQARIGVGIKGWGI